MDCVTITHELLSVRDKRRWKHGRFIMEESEEINETDQNQPRTPRGERKTFYGIRVMAAL